MKITFKENGNAFMILFDDVIHIFVKKEYFSSLTSYYSEGYYYMEFYSKDDTIMTLKYEEEIIWRNILKLLKDNL